MKISKIETIQVPEHPHLIWVQVVTDQGIIGTGETTPRVSAVRRVIHDTLADLLIGRNPLEIERLWRDMAQAIHYHGHAGTEFRALSAIDLALWDILAQVAGLPLYQVLGGACRTRVPVYNTCVTYGTIDDREAFLTKPEALADSLLAEGIDAMKIWPFDEASIPRMGQSIAEEDLLQGVDVVERIRKHVGTQMSIAIEGHACWNLPSAVKIARALEPYDIMFIEDMIVPDGYRVLSELRSQTTIPVCGSERLFGRAEFLSLLEHEAVDIVMPDLVWTGGITEFRKISAMADTFQRPLAPHNCGGPIATLANIHVCAHIPNLFRLEVVRAFYHGFYEDLVTDRPKLEDGSFHLPTQPGIGARLRPELLQRNDIVIEVSDSVKSRDHWALGDPWKDDLGNQF